MGLLDGLLSAVGGGASQQADASAHHGLVDEALSMIGNSGTGGLGGMLDKFRAAGLGNAVDSWVGNGPNQTITGDHVTSALGVDQIAQLASRFGIPKEQVASHLAQILPDLVNRLTPNGQVPADHGVVQSAIGLLKGRLFG